MNYSTAIIILNPNIRVISVTYEPDMDNVKAKRTLYKSFDKTLEKGDLVIVPTDTRHEFTVAQVDEVDVDIDFDDSKKVNWIVERFDTSPYTKLLKQEAEMIKVVKESENRAKREKMRENMLGLQDEKGLDSLAITSMSGDNDTAALTDSSNMKEKKTA